ncbi:MAG: SDR family oxidoreductase [Stellaceae bacterium]
MSRLFCFGLGYSAAALARKVRGLGWSVAGTSRENESCAALAALGYDMCRFSRTYPLRDSSALAGTTHLLLGIPPDDAGDPVETLCGTALASPELQWAGYLSTTAVYGDRGGDWVDELTPSAPSSERGRRRLAAEEAWRRIMSQCGMPLHVFRLAGIYGPGRSAFDQVRAGAPRIAKLNQVFSRIHVEDLAEALFASMAQPTPGALYNICDDEPASQSEVVAHAARLLGRTPTPELPFAEAPLSEMARSFFTENKRVRNARMKAQLGIRLRYPTYREGLAAILAAEPVMAPRSKPR